jgi:capsular exopolysaccharide synthesis family protein
MVMALGAGTLAAFVRENVVGGFRSVRQLETVTGREVFATVPSSRSKAPSDDLTSERLTHFSEGIRGLRATLALRYPDNLVVAVTSSDPGEGKSTLSLSLAKAFLLAGKSVVLLDADLRHPSLTQLVGDPKADGLYRILSRQRDDEPLVQAIQVEGNSLGFIGAGEGRAYATDALFGSEAFDRMLETVRKQAQVVIIDTPPVRHVTDTRIIATKVDQILYVIQKDGPSQRIVSDGLRILDSIKASAPVHPVFYRTDIPRVESKYSNYYEGF